LKAIFDVWGYEVLAAGSADQALAGLRDLERRPDIIVTDYRLREGRNGAEAIQRIRGVYGAGVPGIVLTGETGNEVQQNADMHSLAIIHKPVTPRQLGDAINRLLAVEWTGHEVSSSR
jgi:CheY-like chemotaxis protein